MAQLERILRCKYTILSFSWLFFKWPRFGLKTAAAAAAYWSQLWLELYLQLEQLAGTRNLTPAQQAAFRKAAIQPSKRAGGINLIKFTTQVSLRFKVHLQWLHASLAALTVSVGSLLPSQQSLSQVFRQQLLPVGNFRRREGLFAFGRFLLRGPREVENKAPRASRLEEQCMHATNSWVTARW